ncbi:MAG TPA: TIGR03618 family F420-dependent PPOX class oxidoreductase [Solirubrobacteraceae bacterium]|nr:TIGR03618 family F420-dependent PPOX class oxidoreductase [Solirubrobacteraceae bacterium]
MLDSESRRILAGPNYAHVATVMEDGSPHSVPVWIGVDDQNRVVFYKEDSSVGLRNLRRDPRVAISITDVQDPYRAALIRGRVVEMRGEPAAAEWLNQQALEYTGERYPDPVPEAGTLVVVEPDRVTYQHAEGFRHAPPG